MKTFTLTEPQPKLREADVATDIKKWLKVRRWHVQRLQSGVVNFGQNPDGSPRLRQLGRKGMADFVAWRPVNLTVLQARLAYGAGLKLDRAGEPTTRGLVELFFYETKAPGRKPSEDQVTWLQHRRVEGFLAEYFDSVEALVAWYHKHFSEAC